MKEIIKAGATSKILQIFIADSSSTTGAGLTGLVYNSGSLTAYYHRDNDTTATAITLVTMTVGTFTSSGFKEIDATNMPGWYQFCPPNAAIASGAKSVGFHLKGASNMAPLPIEVQLSVVDLQDGSTFGVTSASVWDALTSALTTSGSIGKLLVDNVNATVSSRLASASISLSGGSVTVGTNSDKTGYTVSTVSDKTGYSLSSGGIQAIWDALTSALTTAGSIGKLLVDNINATISSRLPTTSISLAAGAVTVGTNNDKTGYALSGTQTFNVTGNITGNLSGSVGSLGATAIAGIWSALTSALTTSGSIGKLLVDNINATISSRLPTALITLTGGKVDVNDKTGFSLSPGGLAGVWTILTSSLTTAGSIGKLLVDNVNATISSRLPTANITLAGGSVTVGTNSDKTGYSLSSGGLQAIWDAWTSALTTTGSIGKLLVDNINATISSRLASASVSLSAGAVTVGTNNDKTGYALSSAGVDSILDDAPSVELASIPGSTATLRLMVQFIYQYFRGKKTITATTETLYKEDGTTSLGTATLSNDLTTFTKGKSS